MSKLETITIDTPSGSNTMQIGSTNTATINLGASGDTINIPAGATIANAGTATGFASTPVAGTEAFSAKLTGNDNNITDSSWYKITFNNEVFDTGSNFDTSTGRYTAPSAGKYFFGTAVYVWGGNNFNNCATRLYKNGVSNSATGNYFNYSDGNHFSEWYQEASQILDLAQNDYIEVYQYVNFASGTAQVDAVSRFFGFKLA
jgi:hypothetical protein